MALSLCRLDDFIPNVNWNSNEELFQSDSILACIEAVIPPLHIIWMKIGFAISKCSYNLNSIMAKCRFQLTVIGTLKGPLAISWFLAPLFTLLQTVLF